MIVNMKGPISFSGNRFLKANYIIYINGKPLYAGQSRDVLKRVAKHRSMLKNHSQFATGRSVNDLDWDSSKINACLFNIGENLPERKELEKLIHEEVDSLLSNP